MITLKTVYMCIQYVNKLHDAFYGCRRGKKLNKLPQAMSLESAVVVGLRTTSLKITKKQGCGEDVS